MNRQDAVILTRWIKSSFPSQHVDEFTSEAIWKQMRDFRREDAETAIDTLVGRGASFCSPGDLLAEVQRIRTKRRAEHAPLIPPDHLDDAQQLRWMADAYRRVGDGEVIDCTYGVLVTGPSINFRELLPAPDTQEDA